jgi:hypothetical protein
MESIEAWALATAFAILAALLTAITACSIYDTNKTAELVLHGADPIKAMCALRPSRDTAALCMAAVMKE